MKKFTFQFVPDHLKYRFFFITVTVFIIFSNSSSIFIFENQFLIQFQVHRLCETNSNKSLKFSKMFCFLIKCLRRMTCKKRDIYKQTSSRKFLKTVTVTVMDDPCQNFRKKRKIFVFSTRPTWFFHLEKVQFHLVRSYKITF